ncbi:hypothetical protein FA95DRAFT_1567053 [Auriscalpium vulgare]|uniref:Uncharacterized protein n=1 Tax=Auriscalpium vulgare TaxID=40419 RepID=A0ACB8R7T6_9AGAM|nr:hypothetical protein FA95DRAFT_1567053 [Auriscalpium vulgare]
MPSDPSVVASNNVAMQPIFQFNASASEIYPSSEAIFRTQMLIFNADYDLRSTVENYPFDLYYTEIFMFGIENGTNKHVALSIDLTMGVAFGFKVSGMTLSSDDIDNYIANGLTGFSLSITRGVLVKAYVMSIIIAMWIIDLMLVAISIRAVLFGYKTDSAILVVPIATLFAFTSLRSSMPGAPAAFGAIIDFVGTFPTLAYLLFATVLSLASFLRAVPVRQPQAQPAVTTDVEAPAQRAPFREIGGDYPA